ncbi:Tex family protein [Heyndrickxia coagulans]|uniref:Tex family protein n=1 Tax=Heyndrickxia coagulans TaxID=1398 RepID=UPI003D3005D6
MVFNLEEKQERLISRLGKELHFPEKSIRNVIGLLEDGNTVPFIARYRKEMTGALDEVQIRDIMERWNYLQNLEQRKEEVIRLIDEQGKLTEELKGKILQAEKLQLVEDLYRPYKQKRRTRATIAKEKGLEPLASWMLSFPVEGDLDAELASYVSAEKQVASAEEALQGAKDIIAEMVSDEPKYRGWIRGQTFKTGVMASTVNEASITARIVKEAVEDGYKRLIEPAIEREIRNELSEKAEDRAIHIFAENLRNLLLQPPLKGKTVLGVDPAYRTGCKLAVVDETGKVLKIGVIYPHPPKPKTEEAKAIVKSIIRDFKVEVIAIGNGTASQETEQWIAGILKEIEEDVSYVIVNEAGASVYSASDLARKEFPDLHVEERSAVSIARRLQDPLAELVKIDPKSVGVGQYQHDVSQKKLNESLTFVVETAVNQVGVDVNTASPSLLQYVSGLSSTVAGNIVKFRDENGKFKNRTELKKIPRLGAKTYEQSIGFLRIPDGEEPLDKTPIHPESYDAARALLNELGMTTADIGTEKLIQSLEALSVPEMAKTLGIGELTLQDIFEALKKPGRDPRDELPKPLLKKDIMKLEDLKPGMEMQGTVRNVVDFGAFVDVGVKEDGLVHISKLSKGFVKHPLDIVSVGDIVTVWVEKVDVQKGRLSLTMLPNA